MCAGNTGEEGPDGETWSNDEPRVGVDDVCWKHWRGIEQTYLATKMCCVSV